MKTTKSLRLCIYESDGSTYKVTHIIIPENSEGTFQVTCKISSTTVALWMGLEFQTGQNSGEYFYTDNWNLILNDD